MAVPRGEPRPGAPGALPGPQSDGELKLGWIGDVQLSPDGRKVLFRKPAFFFPDRFEYDVSSGTLRKVEWTDPTPADATARAPCAAFAPRR